MAEHVVLVDQYDTPLGTEEKLKAHREGRLHRAFSVFVFNSRGEMLLQQRAHDKYHSGGLWANTCCSHPRPGEDVETAAHRRLQEEMGFDCPLEPAFTFIYQTPLEGGLIEHELDHVLVGLFDGEPKPDPGEVAGARWTAVEEVARDVAERPEAYAYWFRAALPRTLGHTRVEV